MEYGKVRLMKRARRRLETTFSATSMHTRTGHHRQQKVKKSLENKKSKQFEEVETTVLGVNSNYDDTVSNISSASPKGPVNGSTESRSKRTIRRPAYWLEMRGVKNSVNKSPEKKGEVLLKGKRKSEQGEGEDVEDSPKKKQKIWGILQESQEPETRQRESLEQGNLTLSEGGRAGKNRQAGTKQNSKRKGHCVQKETETYGTGSMEEQWSLEIQDKGRVTCPTCRAVVRKTVEGLKKHMANCRQEMFTCHQCGKQLKSSAGMKYHVMADHNNQPVVKEGEEVDEQLERDRLRKVLKCMGKLKCTREGCTGSFTSIMGYLYHVKKCGKAASELEKMAMKCHHCGKAYRSKAGLVYHLRSKHGPVTFLHEERRTGNLIEMKQEQNNTGRVQRRSAKVAIYYLHELAGEELAKEWPKRKVLQDLIPDDRKLKYTRPGLPTFSQDVLCKWKAEIKMYRRVHCPNQGCESVYGSVSGLKSHLGTCTLGDFVAGKYKCLLCEKEFISESGVKYHINSVHAEDWFDMNTMTTKSFEKLMKIRQREEQRKQRKKRPLTRGKKKKAGTLAAKKLPTTGVEKMRKNKRGRPRRGDNESASSEEGALQVAQRAEFPKTSRKRGRSKSLEDEKV
ncbi:zinc finger protein 512 isoform X1 [Manacus vitellinus]|uniref:zinc finger protein 512 isoform X1 n=1 Tax=Manacus vitellinus TaxID=328815 RepID=UPI000846FE16|nr:zinc finger protein 512 isoform X1 [Manacus vitellinus]